MSTINTRNSQAAETPGSLEEAAPIVIQLSSRTVSAYDSPGIPVEIIPSQPGHDVPGWKSIIVNFSPSYVSFNIPYSSLDVENNQASNKCTTFLCSKQWFTVSMGTGIVSILLYSIPFQTK
ncbi:hypothetical protein N7476_004789 [Penicillium atrosanguineum]|uniref:Uncharacterized protein n=1 Tax=Penicillium atrosanguineum TaxID=1132637 RepID=A0A9W9U4V7_9EURO|nr:hypothetical protein N7476_004789 [Penicillium atrosanguineum]